MAEEIAMAITSIEVVPAVLQSPMQAFIKMLSVPGVAAVKAADEEVSMIVDAMHLSLVGNRAQKTRVLVSSHGGITQVSTTVQNGAGGAAFELSAIGAVDHARVIQMHEGAAQHGGIGLMLQQSLHLYADTLGVIPFVVIPLNAVVALRQFQTKVTQSAQGLPLVVAQAVVMNGKAGPVVIHQRSIIRVAIVHDDELFVVPVLILKASQGTSGQVHAVACDHQTTDAGD